jgi:hypothetical protein
MIRLHGGIPRFASTIRFVSKPEFEALPKDKSTQYADYPWGLDEMVSMQPRAYTDSAACCNVVGVQNGQNVSLMHLQPSANPPELVKMALTHEIEQLREKGQKLRAFLTGGDKGDNSSRLGVGILDNLNYMGVPTSIFWGHDKALCTDAHYDTQTDTWSIYAPTTLEKPAIEKGITTLEELKEAYKVIQVAPGDHVFLGNQEIPRESIERWESTKMVPHAIIGEDTPSPEIPYAIAIDDAVSPAHLKSIPHAIMDDTPPLVAV